VFLLSGMGEKTHWDISSGDASMLREWAPNDYVIIGYNSGWDSSCECILINVNMNSTVRAKQF
jgi:hypothetical protein